MCRGLAPTPAADLGFREQLPQAPPFPSSRTQGQGDAGHGGGGSCRVTQLRSAWQEGPQPLLRPRYRPAPGRPSFRHTPRCQPPEPPWWMSCTLIPSQAGPTQGPGRPQERPWQKQAPKMGLVVALSALRRRRGASLGEKPLTQLWGCCQDVGPRGRPGCCSARATKG